MKKLYIQPTIMVEVINASEILAGSPEVKTENTISEETTPGINGTITGGTDDGSFSGFGAKGGSKWSDDTDW